MSEVTGIVRVPYTAQHITDLFDVNAKVNDNVEYETDQEQYGVAEFWAVAGKRGDCEDYALAKMKQLRALGWPQASLDIAICTVAGQGHAVLCAHTDAGDIILDNNRERPVRWDQCTDYAWLETSVGGNFRTWRKIGPA